MEKQMHGMRCSKTGAPPAAATTRFVTNLCVHLAFQFFFFFIENQRTVKNAVVSSSDALSFPLISCDVSGLSSEPRHVCVCMVVLVKSEKEKETQLKMRVVFECRSFFFSPSVFFCCSDSERANVCVNEEKRARQRVVQCTGGRVRWRQRVAPEARAPERL